MKFEEMNCNAKTETARMFEAWLGCYTMDVIVKVLERRDEILENDFAMNLIKELYKRKEEEKQERTRSFIFLLNDFETFKNSDVHNNVLTHSSSYRDVLYDMYIR